MNVFLEKLASATYDLVGLVFPGAVALFVWVGIWFGFAHAVDGVPDGLVDDVANWTEQYTLWAIVVVAVLGYFTGFVLRWIARGHVGGAVVSLIRLLRRATSEPQATPFQWWRILLFLASGSPLRHHATMASLGEVAVAKLRTRLGLDDEVLAEWYPFRMVAKTYVMQTQTKSLLTTYQNRYTFHRSLATAFSVSVWGSLFAAVALLCDDAWCNSLAFAGFALLFGVLTWMSAHQFNRNWSLWGDSVIAETVVAMCEKESSEES